PPCGGGWRGAAGVCRPRESLAPSHARGPDVRGTSAVLSTRTGLPRASPRGGGLKLRPHPRKQRRRLIADFLDAYERSAPEGVRRDGWTPFLRKLFLQTIADTGRITLACAYTHMSRSAAYALAQRDRVFAAAWDAADQFARRALADHAKEQMLEGITETVTRPD